MVSSLPETESIQYEKLQGNVQISYDVAIFDPLSPCDGILTFSANLLHHI